MLDFSLSSVKDVLEILAICGAFGASVFMLKMRSTFMSRHAFAAWVDEHEKDHQSIDQRLQAGEAEFTEIKGALSKLATAEQVQDLRVMVTKVEGDLTSQDEKIEGHHQVSLRNEHLLNTIHNHLLNRG